LVSRTRHESFSDHRFNHGIRRKIMAHRFLRTILAVLSVAMLYVSLAPEAPAQDTCSLATIAGKWGATLTGTVLFPAPIGPAPAAAVIRFDIDTAGNVSGTEARDVGGKFANETLKGKVSVNQNCTGTTTVNFFESGALVRTSALSLVFDVLSTHVRMVQRSLILPNGTKVPVVITVEGEKLSGD
jgi:hypothetical protein